MDPTLDGARLIDQALNQTVLGLSMAELGRWALLTIMFNMGLALEPADFARLARAPRAVGMGLAGQILLLPLVGFALVLLFRPDLPIAVGIILLACCPGAATSNFFSYLARGDIALSVTLTALSGVVVLVTMPLLVNLGLWLLTGAGETIRLPVLQTMREIALLLLLPAGIGMLLRAWGPAPLIGVLQGVVTKVAFAFMLAVVLVTFSGIWRELPRLLLAYGPYAAALNLGCMGLSWWLAGALRLPEAQRRTIAIEVGIQNFLLAMVIATTVLRNADYVIFPLSYLFMMYLSAFGLVAWCRRVPVVEAP